MPIKQADESDREKSAAKPARKPRERAKKLAEPGIVTGPPVEFPIVGIGASAGGLEAFEQFFKHMPPDAGMAFVLVQHLDPTHKSILTELVKRFTAMRVNEIQDAMTVEPNTVYVIPPNCYLAILHGKLLLLEPTKVPGLRVPIDFFFRSLAEDRKERAICIVLSGTGTEGAMGLRAIKGEGGMGMVQDPESAKYDGMPRSAVATGLADYILPPEKMPEQLISYVGHALVKSLDKATRPIAQDTNLLAKVLILVRSHTGHDFSFYKKNTILRRIDRRMAVHQLSHLADYVRYIQEDPREAGILFKELLIGVTNFFRDKEAFDALRVKALSKLFDGRPTDRPIRVWIPGCATGEEAYTIAIICRDLADGLNRDVPVQIFATDIDYEAIETARTGLYPDSIAVDVAPEFLDRYFAKEDSFHRVKKEIRDMVVFASQNVITDPPFSKIDLISCRNLLIYLGPELQKRVLPLFHYSLRKDGFLFLGSSESIGEFTDYFSVTDRKWKLFQRKDIDRGERPIIEMVAPTATDRRIEAHTPEGTEMTKRTNYRDVAERIVLDSYGPTAVIVSEKGDVLFILGRAGRYLEPPAGDFTGNLVAMAREGLKLEMATAIRKCSVHTKEIRLSRVAVKTNGGEQLINLVVRPVLEPASMKGTMIVIFEDVPTEQIGPNDREAAGPSDTEHHPRVQQLQQELRSTKEYLQTTIEELETSNEELKSTNEELQSSNEELQSTNEELETSKEELQSVNEELSTVNSELQQKIEDLSKVSSDLNNLLASTQIATIFLDTNLRIQRFTPTVTDFINLIQTDVGRPVSHIVFNMKYDGLIDDAKQVLNTLAPREMEIQTKDGRWFTMRILPYRTVENVIDGVVITFVETTHIREISREKRETEMRYRALLDHAAYSITLVDAETGEIKAFNEMAYKGLGYAQDDYARMTLQGLVVQHSPEELKELMGRTVKQGCLSFETKLRTKLGQPRSVFVSAMFVEIDGRDCCLAVIHDITGKKREDTGAS